MIITQIKQKGKSDEYYLYIDNAFSSIVKLETIYKHRLIEGQEVEKKQLEELILEDQKIMAFDKSLNFISLGLKSTKQVKDNLSRKGFSHDAVDYAILKLKEYGYIDDEKYAQAFVDTYRNGRGRLLLSRQLNEKGISKQIIDKILENADFFEDNAIKTAEKYMKNKTYDLNTKAKLFRHLQSKGFTFEEIKRAVDISFREKGVENEDW